MTTFVQFCAGAKMRHDFSDMIQVRYPHSGGENFDTWVSGEEVMARLKTMSREQLIQSFGRMEWQEAREALTDRRNTDIFLVTVRVFPVREEILVVALPRFVLRFTFHVSRFTFYALRRTM